MSGLITFTVVDHHGHRIHDETLVVDYPDMESITKAFAVNGDRHELTISFDPPIVWKDQ